MISQHSRVDHLVLGCCCDLTVAPLPPVLAAYYYYYLDGVQCPLLVPNAPPPSSWLVPRALELRRV